MKIFLDIFGQSVAVGDCFGCLYDNLWNKLFFGVYKAENDCEIRVHKVNRRLVIFWE